MVNGVIYTCPMEGVRAPATLGTTGHVREDMAAQ